MNKIEEKIECRQTAGKQAYSMLKCLLFGTLIILAVGSLSYIILFALMLLM